MNIYAMKKIITLLSAPYLMITLFVVLAASMGIATFVENDFGTNAAKALFYNAWWFEGIFLFLGINMLLNILKPYMWNRGKLPVLLFHLSFLLIILGAALTRYVGYEGMMHIREGKTSDEFLSSKTYIEGTVEEKGQSVFFSEEVFLSEKSKTYFSKNVKLADKRIHIKSIDYIKNTRFVPVEDPDGKPMVSLVVSGVGGRRDVNLFSGQKVAVGAYTIAFDGDGTADFNLSLRDNQLFIQSSLSMFNTSMASQQRQELEVSTPQPFYQKILYGTEGFFLVQTSFLKSASLKAMPAENEQGNSLESVVVRVEVDGIVKQMTVLGTADSVGDYETVSIDGVKINIKYGARILKLPFKIQLNDFQLERYPGSESPSSFASEVTLLDKQHGVESDFRIFMNNILNYKGYRFYQSSYDMDEKGTVLSVNNDYWGTLITYIGYFIMSLFMLLSLIASKGRFNDLANKLSDLASKKKALTLIMLFTVSLAGFSQSVDEAVKVSEKQAELFGRLWVQDNGGRVKPMNSMNGEVLRKLVKHNSFKGYSADRVALSILCEPETWERIPLITVAAESIKAIVGNRGKKASFKDFFGPSGNYKLHEQVESAYRTKPAYRSKEQNDLIKIDEQVNVFYLAKTGKLLKMFPDPDDEHAPWIYPGDYRSGLSSGDSLFVRNVFTVYLQSLRTGDDKQAETYIDAILKYQGKFAQGILPSEKEKQLEIFYNKSNVFLMIAPVFFVLGLILLILQFIFLFLPNKSPKGINKAGLILFLIGFAVYTAGLAMRWYVSGHAPWSNSYESMLYIGWSMLLAGLVFSKKSGIVLSVGGLFSGIVLMVAHLTWMNPEITNLVPVLKSYWLTIHVAVIVASYGFLGLGAFVAFFNLILIGLRKDDNDQKIKLTIAELTTIIEMTLTVGLYLMTIGSFLGGVWANESWGRYWGWDPKETWSLVTVVVYAIILHLRFVPGLKSKVVFNVVSVLGFFSVLMTYLGVNYYLAGMHSYAKGDPVPIPDFVYYIVLAVFVVAGYALYNENRLRAK